MGTAAHLPRSVENSVVPGEISQQEFVDGVLQMVVRDVPAETMRDLDERAFSAWKGGERLVSPVPQRKVEFKTLNDLGFNGIDVKL